MWYCLHICEIRVQWCYMAMFARLTWIIFCLASFVFVLIADKFGLTVDNFGLINCRNTVVILVDVF